MESDVDVRQDGCIVLITPVTEDARSWLRENLQTESWQWLGGSLAIDQRYAGPIVEGMHADGLAVEEL